MVLEIQFFPSPPNMIAISENVFEKVLIYEIKYI